MMETESTRVKGSASVVSMLRGLTVEDEKQADLDDVFTSEKKGQSTPKLGKETVSVFCLHYSIYQLDIVCELDIVNFPNSLYLFDIIYKNS